MPGSEGATCVVVLREASVDSISRSGAAATKAAVGVTARRALREDP